MPYSERPMRFDYRLTQKGRDLWPVLTTMRQWGDAHAAPDGPPLALVHRSCGHVVDAVMTCSACGAPISARDVRAERGPGAVEDLFTSPQDGSLRRAAGECITSSKSVEA
jgi:hypothetical protein